MKISAAIYGAGGHARVIASILHTRTISILGFFDDNYHGPENIMGAPVLGRFQEILKYAEIATSIYIAQGNNGLREESYAFLSENGFNLPNLIHPSAVCETNSKIGNGSVVCLGAIIGTQAEIGKGVLINTGCCVDHETCIGDFSHLAPKVAIAGRTRIGANTFIGIGSCVADKLTIGKNVIIGAGSVVMRDVPDGARVCGMYH